MTMDIELLCGLYKVKGQLASITELDACLYIGETDATNIIADIQDDIDKMIEGVRNEG